MRMEGDTEVRVEPPYHGTWEITFDALEKLSQALGTKSINLRFAEGWLGTEVTPGDLAEFCLHIKDIRLGEKEDGKSTPEP